jgi:exodeoxyribonuclease VII large subunit
MTFVYKISELTEYIKSLLCNKKIRVIGEVSQPKHSGGHLYFTLKDDSNNIKAIIWKSKNIDKDNIIEGNKVTLECKIDFYGGNSNVSLIVDKLITNDGYGDLFMKYEKIKKDFTNKGYFNKQKSILPNKIKNILILTSEEGAALQDFIYNLDNNKSNLLYDIIDVKVQGVECPKNICDILEQIKIEKVYYDIVIITRGGGSFSDLFGFSQPELIESIYNFNLPVLTAIGHMVDNPLCDMIDYSSPTPSLAAQFIVDYNKKYLSSIYSKIDNIKIELINNIIEEQNKYNKMNENLYKSFNKLISLKSDFLNNIRNDINCMVNKLNKLENKLNIEDNINLYYNNKRLNKEELPKYKNKQLLLRWGDQEYKIMLSPKQ